MLCFKTKARALLIHYLILSGQRSVKEITGIELNTRLGGANRHFYTTGRVEHFGSNLEAFAIQNPAMIVALAEHGLLM